MEITHNRIAVEAYQGEDPPFDVVNRERGELWLVSHEPIRLDQPIVWRQHRKEDLVYIPLCPYLTRTEPDLSMAFFFQLGCRVSFDLQRPITKLHVAIGGPVHEVMQQGIGNMWQMQLGFGVQVK